MWGEVWKRGVCVSVSIPESLSLLAGVGGQGSVGMVRSRDGGRDGLENLVPSFHVGCVERALCFRSSQLPSSYIQLLVWSRTSSLLHLLGPGMGMEVAVAGRVTVKPPTEEEERRC